MGQLACKAPATKQKYKMFFLRFAEFMGKSPDELLEKREQDVKSEDKKVKRHVETDLLTWISELKSGKGEDFAAGTKQIAFASVKSFFEINEQPLKMHRGDYPTGESIGSRAFTRELVKKVLDENVNSRFDFKFKAL